MNTSIEELLMLIGSREVDLYESRKIIDVLRTKLDAANKEIEYLRTTLNSRRSGDGGLAIGKQSNVSPLRAVSELSKSTNDTKDIRECQRVDESNDRSDINDGRETTNFLGFSQLNVKE